MRDTDVMELPKTFPLTDLKKSAMLNVMGGVWCCLAKKAIQYMLM